MDFWNIYLNDDSELVVGRSELPLRKHVRAVGDPFIVAYNEKEFVYILREKEYLGPSERHLFSHIKRKAYESAETINANAYRMGRLDTASLVEFPNFRAVQLYIISPKIISKLEKDELAQIARASGYRPTARGIAPIIV